MFKNENVLVAGGTGFIGTNLIQRMLDLGANVRATVHVKKPVIKDDRIDYVKCDLLNMDDCKRVVKDMDYVFLCAANTSGAAVIAHNPLVLTSFGPAPGTVSILKMVVPRGTFLTGVILPAETGAFSPTIISFPSYMPSAATL